ncbi:oxidoreductase [Ramlibacter sp. AW1]|uniref:Oxidoreductase n=1 Tax=Ramlibacter aurantiacus TaxID=2801330 RepID=A0A936ZDR4_9BURK|nr:PDR/VanB family oxidoreductase [Ramlibacter aurantiacus]MBL0419067.1 oxidoreductase [Ramlibacter aurantiacus]
MSAEIDAVVHGVRAVARDVVAITLRHAHGQPLPGATPGAHIDLELPNGQVRQYSLVDAAGAARQDEYVVAVGWDAASRGGSHWIHEKLKVGQRLRIGTPRNLFEMDAAHRKVLLVAGGIGITPIYAMARHAAAQGLDWSLVACARSAPRLAYLEELRALAGPRLRTHFDDEQGRPIDLAGLLVERLWDAVYACGPAPMLDAIGAATAHWSPGHVRLERFQAAEVDAGERRRFELVLARRGVSTQVDSREGVLDALERLGVDHPWACREGLCGTCEAGVVEGEVQHLDQVLAPAEKAAQRRMMVCVSRCAGPRLVLDL